MLKIESEMDGSCLCCGAAPALEIPVVYYSDAPAQPPLPPINYEWNPTVFDPLVYRLDENNSVVPSAPPVEI